MSGIDQRITRAPGSSLARRRGLGRAQADSGLALAVSRVIAEQIVVLRVGLPVAVVVEPVADLVASLAWDADVGLDAVDASGLPRRRADAEAAARHARAVVLIHGVVAVIVHAVAARVIKRRLPRDTAVVLVTSRAAGCLTSGCTGPDPADRARGHEVLVGRAVAVIVHAVTERFLRALKHQRVLGRAVGAVRDPVTVDVSIAAGDALAQEADLAVLSTGTTGATTPVRPTRGARAVGRAVGHAGALDTDLAGMAQGRGLLVSDAVAVVIQRIALLVAGGAERRAGEARAVLLAQDHAPVARTHATGHTFAIEAAPVGERHLEALVGVAVTVIVHAVAGLVHGGRGRTGVDLGARVAGQEPRGRAASLPAAGLRGVVVFIHAAVAVVVDPVAARLGAIHIGGHI